MAATRADWLSQPRASTRAANDNCEIQPLINSGRLVQFSRKVLYGRSAGLRPGEFRRSRPLAPGLGNRRSNRRVMVPMRNFKSKESFP
jgi:hypothetical protein